MAADGTLYRFLLYTVFIASVIVCILLYRVTAPYGRHVRKGWGPVLGARAGWMIMEFPAVAVITLCYLLSDRQGDLAAVFFLGLWELHYLRRTFIFPLMMRTGRSFPLLLVAFAMVFNTINGYLNGIWLFHLSSPYTLDWFSDPRFIAGIAVFLTGYGINVHADTILRNLRRPGETGYRIPQGGLYRLISCPNYFGEIVEWTGWAIATWSVPGLAFAVFTAANLVPRAHAHHRWYRETFPDYPKNRKAVIPFIY